ncbi:MAG: N-acetylmuramoyl-L-alanine amidase [Eubacteriales bacterium]|nr:N-acetylmuramoyl-L-alanine amidase [Eubacteriales bacterium]
MKKGMMEMILAALLLVCFYVLSRQTAQTLSASQDKPVIAVDPGHGGEDPGMIGIGGLQEKKINLEISLLLKEALEKRGFFVVLTRDGDYGLYEESSKNKKAQDMQERIRIFGENEPVLAVSIHQNSYEDASVKGPQVFYYRDSTEGESLARCIQASMNQLLEVERPREAKGNTSYYLLKRSSAVLNIVECGFLTNPEEAELLRTENYQKQVAEAVAEGICEYLSS